MPKKRKQTTVDDDTHTAASKLVSVLQASRKLPRDCDREAQVARVIPWIVEWTRVLGMPRGRPLSPTTVAVAVARMAGCGASTAAVARTIDPQLESAGTLIDLICDRMVARSHLWQMPMVDEAVEEVSKSTCSTCTTVGAAPFSAATSSNDAAAGAEGVGNGAHETPSPHCSACMQPRSAEDAYYASYTSADLVNCPTCAQCRMPRIPQSCDEMIRMIDEVHGPLTESFDGGRIAPRAHENALWNQTEATRAMRDLLLQGQRSLPFDEIVARSEELPNGRACKPLQVVCECCGKSRNFDWCFGQFTRMLMSENREKKYVWREGATIRGAPSIVCFMLEVVPEVTQQLRAGGIVTKVKWKQCCNCETTQRFSVLRLSNQRAAIACSERLGLQRELRAAWPLGVPLNIFRNELPTLPLAQGQSCRPESEELFSCAVLLIIREVVSAGLDVSRSDFVALLGEPCIRDLFSRQTEGIGDDRRTRAAAGGADVNTALLIVAPSVLVTELQSIQVARRGSVLRERLQADDGQCEAVAAATLDGRLPAAEKVEAESSAFFDTKHAVRRRGHGNEPEGKCETQRVGNCASWASIACNPDVVGFARMYNVPGGRSHTDHLMFVLQPESRGAHVLMMYVSGPFGHPSPAVQAKSLDGAGSKDAKKLLHELKKHRAREDAERESRGLPPGSLHLGADQPAGVQAKLNSLRLAYGQPRSMEIVAGRHFLDASQTENMKLQRQDGAHAEWHRAVAVCGTLAICLFASLALAPLPGNDANAWFERRAQKHTQLIGSSLAETGEL